MVDLVKRTEEALAATIIKEADEAMNDIKKGDLGTAIAMLEKIHLQEGTGLVIDVTGRKRRKGKVSEKLLATLEALKANILRQAGIALAELKKKKPSTKSAMKLLRTIKNEAKAVFAGEVRAEKEEREAA